MDNTVGSELSVCQFNSSDSLSGKSHNIDGNDSAIEINGQALETNVGAQSLHLASEVFANQRSGDSVRHQDTTGWVEVC